MPRRAADAAASDRLAAGEGHVDDHDSGERPDREITDRQLEVLVHVARGRTNRQIGAALGISERTVRNHLRSIGKRLAATDRTHAVVLAIGNGWIAVPIEPEIGTAMLPSPLTAESAT
jgi:DNA-binding NarL/FixJ family response regulator